MSSHSTDTASFFSVLIAALICSLSLAGVAAAQTCPSAVFFFLAAPDSGRIEK